MENALDELIKLLRDTPVTFSRWCRSGVYPGGQAECPCHRCRTQRGEAWDLATEEEARRRATDIDRETYLRQCLMRLGRGR